MAHGASRWLLALELWAGALAVLALAMAFNAALSVSSLEDLLHRAQAAQVEAASRSLLLNLESALRFGKPLSRLVGLDKPFQAVAADLPTGAGLRLALADGSLAERPAVMAKGQEDARRLEDLLGPVTPSADNATSPLTLAAAAARWHLFALRGPDGVLAGRLVVSIPEAAVGTRLDAGLEATVWRMGLCLAGAALALAAGLAWRWRGGRSGGAGTRWLCLGVLAAGLTWFAVWQTKDHQARQLAIVREKAALLADFARRDMEPLLAKGLGLERLTGLQARLEESIAPSPDIAGMAVLDADGRVVWRAGRLAEQADDAESILEPLGAHPGKEGQAGAVRVDVDQARLDASLRQIARDAVTLGVIALLFLVETTLVLLRLHAREGREGNGVSRSPKGGDVRADAGADAGEDAGEDAGGDAGGAAIGLMRPAAFLLLFAIDLSVSFIPLRAEALDASLWGLSRDIVLGLPISVEMACAGLTVALCGGWIDRRGWRGPFLTGLGLAAAGSWLSGAAGTAAEFILARGVTGLGYGLALMSAQGFVVANAREDQRAQGLSHLFAGVYAGSLCGGAAGAMLAQRLGHPPVFRLAAAGLALLACLALLSPRGTRRVAEPAMGKKGGGLLAYLRQRDILTLCLASVLPTAMAFIGYCNYLLPLSLSRSGVGQADIGRVLMVFGLCLIYVAPPLAVRIDRACCRKGWVTGAGLLGAAGMAAVAMAPGLTGAVAAVLLLGLSASVAFTAQGAYALALPATRALGEGRAMGVLGAAERLGQVLGPLFFGACLAGAGGQAAGAPDGLPDGLRSGLQDGLQDGLARGGWLGAAGFLACTLIFLWLARSDRPAPPAGS